MGQGHTDFILHSLVDLFRRSIQRTGINLTHDSDGIFYRSFEVKVRLPQIVTMEIQHLNILTVNSNNGAAVGKATDVDIMFV